eukprot:Nitzschia sp. Nitz4//scaffold2_size372955//221618//223767//NITZ4_000438-RA/size372955-snap-gene-0.93-mRNA-1//-1//CDS//3329546823//1277//frame0
MVRHPKKHSAISATDLCNFHFATPAANDRPNPSNAHSNTRRNNRPTHRTAQDRVSARKRAHSSHFYLHSSPDHSFVLTRRLQRFHQQQQHTQQPSYTFHGVDESVSWDAVRCVRQWDSSQSCCPICLDEDWLAPRVTKCGHAFCLPCILHHVQSYAAANPYSAVKCPCCGIPLVEQDLRPVLWQQATTPLVHDRIRLQKLHRHKGCSAPYLPLPDQPKHANIHTAPMDGDPDAIYSRFNYVDPSAYAALLEAHRLALVEVQASPMDSVFVAMALEVVMKDQAKAVAEYDLEAQLQEQYANPSSGMYQKQVLPVVPPAAATTPAASAWDEAPEEATATSTPASAPSTGSHSNLSASSPSFQPANGRNRGDSIGSYLSVSESVTSAQSQDTASKDNSHPQQHSHSSPRQQSRQRPNRHAGTMYLPDDEVHFFQAENGQLIFLHGFNMACLANDFARTPSGEHPLPPFPDKIEGKIVEVEHLQLTPPLRKRMPFLEHIPNYTDIIMVELDLNPMLTERTRRKFKADLLQRKKKRQSKLQAEKRQNRKAEQEELQRIEERKARLQIVDPDDAFFQMVVPDFPSAPTVEDFPTVSEGAKEPAVPAHAMSDNTSNSALNFSQACRRGGNQLPMNTEESFPSLGSLNAALPSKSTPTQPKASSKKKKGKGKVLLFSTGGQRNAMY